MPPLYLTFLRGQGAQPSCEAGVLSRVDRPVLHPGSGRVLAEIVAAVPVVRRPDRAGRKAAAAIGADIAQHRIDAVGAEGALVAADAGLERGGRQRLVAVLAAWTEFQHQWRRAAASALALARLWSSGASRSRRRFTRSGPAFSGEP